MRLFIPCMTLFALLLAGTILCAAPAQAPAPLSPTATTPAEAKLGKEVCAEIEKECKLVKDEKAVQRLNTIANNIAPYTQRPDVVYSCKVLDNPGINAESIPGGHIYVTKGLLDAVESDDELAGVLAHEIAHNSLHHVMKEMEKAKRANIGQALAMLASVYMNGSRVDANTAEFFMMSNYVKTAILNGYSIGIEEQADKNGMWYLSKQKLYDPAGMYSVMLGFEQMERAHPNENMGCFQDHPETEERLHYLEDEMKELGIKPNLWHVVHFQAEMVPLNEGGKKKYQVKLGSVEVITFAVLDSATDAAVRARAVVAVTAINDCLRKAFVQQFDVVADCTDESAVISMPNDPVITLTQADAAAARVSLEYLANRTKANIQNAIMREKIKRGW